MKRDEPAQEVIDFFFTNKPKKAKRKKKRVRYGSNVNKPKKVRTAYGMNKRFMEYPQARIFVQSLGVIKSAHDYLRWHKIKKYRFLPAYPPITYGENWKGWGDFLGVYNEWSPNRGNFPVYEEAKKITQKLALKHNLLEGNLQQNWRKFYDAQMLLPRDERDIIGDMSRMPQVYYDKRGVWEGWPIFMGKKIENRLDQLQKHAEIREEIKTEQEAKYAGQSVYGIANGVDPSNPNFIKIIVSHTGIRQLLHDCESLHYNLLAVYIFEPTKTASLIEIFNNHGLDRGNSCYLIRDVRRLAAELNQYSVLIPPNEYRIG